LVAEAVQLVRVLLVVALSAVPSEDSVSVPVLALALLLTMQRQLPCPPSVPSRLALQVNAMLAVGIVDFVHPTSSKAYPPS